MHSHGRTGSRGRRLAAGLATTALLAVAGCGTGGIPAAGPSPAQTADPASASPTGSPGDTVSPTPSDTGSGTAGPSDSVTADPSDSASPATPGSTVSPSGDPVGCTGARPTRVDRVDVQPRRTTEVATVVSNGNSLTPGTREQTEFVSPAVQDSTGAEVDDPVLVAEVASLVGGNGRPQVLHKRPEPPDAGLTANRRPFSSPGTYVVFNASAPLRAVVIVSCGGQEQRWSFVGETSPASGQINCAVEPPRRNALAHAVHASNCE